MIKLYWTTATIEQHSTQCTNSLQPLPKPPSSPMERKTLAQIPPGNFGVWGVYVQCTLYIIRDVYFFSSMKFDSAPWVLCCPRVNRVSWSPRGVAPSRQDLPEKREKKISLMLSTSTNKKNLNIFPQCVIPSGVYIIVSWKIDFC